MVAVHETVGQYVVGTHWNVYLSWVGIANSVIFDQTAPLKAG